MVIFAYNNYPPDLGDIENVDEILMTFIPPRCSILVVLRRCRRCRRSLTRHTICCWPLGLSWGRIAKSELCNWVEWKRFLWSRCWRSCLKMKMILLDGGEGSVHLMDTMTRSLKMRLRKPRVKERWRWVRGSRGQMRRMHLLPCLRWGYGAPYVGFLGVATTTPRFRLVFEDAGCWWLTMMDEDVDKMNGVWLGRCAVWELKIIYREIVGEDSIAKMCCDVYLLWILKTGMLDASMYTIICIRNYTQQNDNNVNIYLMARSVRGRRASQEFQEYPHRISTYTKFSK